MRLIDADKFKKYISNMPLTNSTKEMLKYAIKSQPTAYNIDKVVEELEKEREEILNSNDYENEIINYCLDSFDKAIEIVKKGGAK